jgi:hypothetical protein
VEKETTSDSESEEESDSEEDAKKKKKKRKKHKKEKKKKKEKRRHERWVDFWEQRYTGTGYLVFFRFSESRTFFNLPLELNPRLNKFGGDQN